MLGTVLAFTVGSSVAFNLESEMKEMGKDFYENFYYSELNKSISKWLPESSTKSITSASKSLTKEAKSSLSISYLKLSLFI